MGILIEWPLLALIPLAVFLTLFIWSRSRLALVAAPCGRCTCPLLIVTSVLVVVSALRAGLRGGRAGI